MPSDDRPQSERPPSKPQPKVAGSRTRLARPRFTLPYTVDPKDEQTGFLTGIERLQRDAKSGGYGVFVSLVMHGLLILLLGLIVFQTRHTADGDPLIAIWSQPGERAERAAKSRRSIAVPIEVASIRGDRPPVPPPVNPTGEETTTAPIGIAPVNVTEALTGRNPRARLTTLEKLGGSPDAERAITAGLTWLARQQTSDGHWELHQGYPDAGRSYMKTDTGATALALLAFLGHGDTHQTGEHQQVVSKGLDWLQKIQDPTTGDLHDQRQEEGRNAAFYAHSMATIVLCESLAMTRDEKLRPAAELAIKYLIGSQHPDLGGWKYRPLTQRVMLGDISVSAWALMALHSARIAGIEIPLDEFQRSARFLDQVQAQGGSRYKYEPNEPESRVTPARTAIGLLCRQWLGWPKTHPPMLDGIRFLMDERNRPQWSAGHRNVFEWYYITQVMHNMGGDDWKQWNQAVRDAVVRNQVASGNVKAGQDVRGSWSPRPEGAGEEYADKAGRLYLTAMCVLILETPYRHRPVYEE